VRGTARAVATLLMAVAGRQQLVAQSATVVDVGVSSARFTGDATSLTGPQLRISATGAQRLSFENLEIGAMGTRSAALGYVGLMAGIRTPEGYLRHDLTAELSAIGSTTSTGNAITALLGARTLHDAGAIGGWLRGSGQFAGRGANVYFGGSVDAASWLRAGRNEVSATLVQEWTRASLYAGPQRSTSVGTVPVQYLEAGLNVRAERDATALNLGVTSRRDAGANHLYEQSYGGTAVYWTGESTAIVLAVAHQLPDYVRGGDALDGVSVSLRFGQASPATARPTVNAAMIQFTGTADTRTVRIHVPDARTVEIMGDFTNWEPRVMTRNGAVFESVLRVTSGTHRLMVRIDAGEWRAPANTPAVDDDFGGRVGLLVVP
jgi:hypothetical protein